MYAAERDWRHCRRGPRLSGRRRDGCRRGTPVPDADRPVGAGVEDDRANQVIPLSPRVTTRSVVGRSRGLGSTARKALLDA